MNKQTKAKGFTIIEVVLVLAIAGLIFLIVFLAVPALQRGQRDSQRRSDASRLLSGVQQYQSNNKGNLPQTQTEVDAMILNYLLVSNDTWEDPRNVGVRDYDATAAVKNGYNTTWLDGATAANLNRTVPDGQVDFVAKARCAGENGALVSATATDSVALRVKLEGGGHYCVNN